MPPSKLSPFSSFCFRVRTLLSACLAGFFLIGCFGARGGVMKSEETVRGRLGSVITGVSVQGEESWLGSSFILLLDLLLVLLLNRDVLLRRFLPGDRRINL